MNCTIFVILFRTNKFLKILNKCTPTPILLLPSLKKKKVNFFLEYHFFKNSFVILDWTKYYKFELQLYCHVDRFVSAADLNPFIFVVEEQLLVTVLIVDKFNFCQFKFTKL